MAATGEGDGKGAVKPPNWISLELVSVKMAAHEASTGEGIVQRGSLKEKTAVCYPRHLRLLCGAEGDYTWPQVPWTSRGKHVFFTLEDSCARRVQVDLWKLAVKNDADMAKESWATKRLACFPLQPNSAFIRRKKSWAKGSWAEKACSL